jgi:hypothetical protein
MNRLFLALATLTGLWLGVVSGNAQKPGTIVATCRTENGLWGNADNYRAEISKLTNGTAVWRSQLFSAPDKDKWFTFSVPVGGGEFKGRDNSTWRIVVEGDGYHAYFSSGGPFSANRHFVCKPGP